MTINKLPEFAKDGQKNTDDLVLTDGFPVLKKPARQWFNWLFNTLTTKINEIIDADFVARNEIVDNLTTNDATKPVSAKQGKVLQDNKLGKTENAVSATKLQTARTIGGVSFDGTANINLPGVNTAGNQSTTGNAGTATKLATARKIQGVDFDGSADITLPAATTVQKGIVQLVNDLTTGGVDKGLTAEQGKILNTAMFGVGQSYRNVTKNRALNTTYTNTTGKLMWVSVAVWLSAGSTLSGYVDAELQCSAFAQQSSTNSWAGLLVPPGSTYKVIASGITNWMEYSL